MSTTIKDEKEKDWFNFTRQEELDNVINSINNRKDFTFDVNADALYQQYKDKYIQQGKMAMEDTMGQAAALTGGYGNSYAATAGNQAYQSHLSNLNNVIPELYELAYNKYDRETQELQNKYNMLNNEKSVEYGQWLDKYNINNPTVTPVDVLSGVPSNIIDRIKKGFSSNAQLNAYINTLVEEGKITETQATELYGKYQNIETDFINRKWEKSGGFGEFTDQYGNKYDIEQIKEGLSEDVKRGLVSPEEFTEVMKKLADLMLSYK